jgi:hypothetical protein
LIGGIVERQADANNSGLVMFFALTDGKIRLQLNPLNRRVFVQELLNICSVKADSLPAPNSILVHQVDKHRTNVVDIFVGLFEIMLGVCNVLIPAIIAAFFFYGSRLFAGLVLCVSNANLNSVQFLLRQRNGRDNLAVNAKFF